MSRPPGVMLFVVAMVLVIVGMALLFFRDRFWARLLANAGAILVFLAFYLRFWTSRSRR